MNIKKILFPATVLALVGIIGLGTASSALAYRGDPAKTGPNYTAERHEAMEKAFQDNDYNAWKNMMQGRGRVSQVITGENFAKFAEAHRLAEQGKYAEANAIRQELRLGIGQGQKAGFGLGWGTRHGETAQ